MVFMYELGVVGAEITMGSRSTHLSTPWTALYKQ